MTLGKHQWYHFGVGAPPILVDFSGDWDVRNIIGNYPPPPKQPCFALVSLQTKQKRGYPQKRVCCTLKQYPAKGLSSRHVQAMCNLANWLGSLGFGCLCFCCAPLQFVAGRDAQLSRNHDPASSRLVRRSQARHACLRRRGNSLPWFCMVVVGKHLHFAYCGLVVEIPHLTARM